MDKIVVRCLSSYRWWLSLQLSLSTPYRFHLIVVWRGSSGLGKIRRFMQAQFPHGLWFLQVPLREWSASTKRSLCAFDLYSLTITHMENCLESERFCLVTRPILSECQINSTHSPLRDSRICIDLCFWSLPHAVWHWRSPWPIQNLGLVYRSGLITSPIYQYFTSPFYTCCNLT